MSKAIGMIEFKTTATGITAADAMVKRSWRRRQYVRENILQLSQAI